MAGLLYVAAKEWITKKLCLLLLQQHLLQCYQQLRQFFLCLALCLYSPGIGVSSICPRLQSSCGDMGEASGKDCFVLAPCTSFVCLSGTGIAFTPSFRPKFLCSCGDNNCSIVIWYITNC